MTLSTHRALRIALGVALLGAAGVLVEAVRAPEHALLAFVAAYGFGIGTSVGALVLAMSFVAAGARWPLVLMPRILAIVSALPVFAVLFVPIALGLRYVYPWARDTSALDAPVQAAVAHQRAWNAPAFFLGRAVVYLGSWCVLGLLLRRAHDEHARAPSPATLARQRRISGGGLPIVALTLTFASFDWFMSLQPGWVSNAYGLYFFCGGLMSSVSVVAILASASRDVRASHVHALGRLMLMAVILWAYIGFFQLMLVWIGDLPREVSFFADRARGHFVVLDAVLLLGHFVVPFLALLSRPLKRRARPLAAVGAWLVLMNAVDVAWLVLPSGGGDVRVLDAAPFLLVLGLAVAYGLRRYAASPAAAMTPSDRALRDPAFAESLRYSSP